MPLRQLVPLLAVATLVAAAPALADLAEFHADGSVVDLRATDGTRLRLTFLASEVVRIQATTTEEFTDEGSGKAPIVLPGDWPGVEARMVEYVDHVTISTDALDLVVHQSPLLLELRRRSDRTTVWRELRPLRLADGATTQTLSSDPAERIHGGGQQNGAFQFNDRLMEISYSGGWEEGDRPSPAPFYMSDRGYGMLRNTWADGTYDFRSAGYLTTTHAENRFDAYVMVGDDIHEILDLYTQLTGRAPLLPRWALGYGDADCYNDGDNVDKPGTVPEGWSDGPTGTTPDVIESLAAKYREHDMPGSWILPNDGYGCGYEQLPEVVAGLREHGFRTGLWTENGVEKIAWEIGTAGTRVQKLDVAWTGKGYQWAMDANHDAAQGFLDNADARPFIWTVMGWAGIQRYAVTWTGDQSGSWDYIRWHVPTLIGSALSGMNYSTGDVDGIFGGSADTFTRDLQWKCFTPVLMGMSGWSKAARKHPWWFDEPHRSINRRYLTLRQRLMPYLYTLAHETELTGAPMVRGIAWDHPDDPRADEFPYQFFLGSDLLVAPVFRSEAASGGWREGVYLPAGNWIDYWTGQVIAGGQAVDVPVDLETLPVLVRAGAIIPMYPASLYDGEVPADPLTLDIYPSGDSVFALYEDDGDTRQYREGSFSTQVFSASVAEDGRRINVGLATALGSYDGMLEERGHEVRLHVTAAPTAMALDGGTLAAEQWSYDVGVLSIDLGRLSVRAAHELVVEFAANAIPAPGPGFPQKPAGDGTLDPDQLMVIARPAEEPGHRLENAFDGDPSTWFRTVRDQSVAYGPHEFTLSLGGRRVVEGFRISPRDDKYWKYGQVQDYEIHLADVNGRWGEPVATGSLEQTEDMQEVRFAPRAGRLLRFRVLNTHDDGVDPMVLGAGDGGTAPFDALAPVSVGPTTISEFRLLERADPATAPHVESLADAIDLHLDGLPFDRGLRTTGPSRFDFALAGDWHTLRTEAGLVSGESARFQVWGDGRLLWDSGVVEAGDIVKPRLDVRGISRLSLRTESGSATTAWAAPELLGFTGDNVRREVVTR